MSKQVAQSDPAYPAMTLDILANVLSRADNPGEMDRYFSEEIRELTGARCVVFIQCVRGLGGTAHRVLSVNPARRRAWAESTAAHYIYQVVHDSPGARVWRANDSGEVALALRREGFAVSLTAPLNVGSIRVGALLVLGLHDHGHLDEETGLITTLSGIVALVLRNAFLYEVQEQTIQERTGELRKANTLLQESETRLRALSSRLERLREEERIRISREIHDELGQLLTGIKLDLAWIEHHLDGLGDDRRLNPVLDKLVATTDLVDSTMKSVQRIASELRPGILDRLGLAAALQYELSRFQERAGIVCRLSLPGSEPELPLETATALFRIFQEALTNVSRHAGASAVEVEFQPEPGWYRLEIRDNGRGIPEANLGASTSLGLLGIRERARLLGGRAAILPRAGGGTVIQVLAPAARSATPLEDP
jgi:signal transduction histidine kinase